ncbi:sulfotransferase family protein [Sphingomicrobium arenosum]|uniref:sulfotransferase family protein n=1 Tax=Sphingomicrobium arenosum TaxID=2233861 RepID=UPI002240B937|nr:sulfotransferase [Sphingomicrobium arenosum]
MSYRYLFIAGLHRTGTSLLAKLLGAHPDIATITDAPVPENEGCYLQGAIPHDALAGRPGHYATDPAQHLVEGGRYDLLNVRERLEADWSRWFADKPWRLEKSPVNLTRMRLYQQLFPLSQFIVITRHPEKMAAALAKWTDQTPAALIDYGLDAYALVSEDAARLHHLFWLRYEDLVADPIRCLDAIFAWIGLHTIGPCATLRDGNGDYSEALMMNGEQASRAIAFGYAPGGAVLECPPRIAHPLRARHEAAEAALRNERSHAFVRKA